MKTTAFNLCLVFVLGFGFLSVLAMHSPAFDVLCGITLIFAMILPACSRKD